MKEISLNAENIIDNGCLLNLQTKLYGLAASCIWRDSKDKISTGKLYLVVKYE